MLRSIVTFSCMLLMVTGTVAEASTLSGLVSRSDTGTPVDSAIILVRGTTLHVRTNSDGVYAIPAIPAGSYGITCWAPGLMASSTAAVDLSQDNSHDFDLQPPGADTVSVTGTTTCDGSPCSAIMLQARNGNTVVSTALSKSDGTFSLNGIPAGTYDFRAMAIGFRVATSPGVAVDLAAPPTVALSLSSAGPYKLSGHVRLDDNPLDRSGSIIRVFGTNPAVSATTIASGEYELDGVPAGPVSIAASRPDYTWHHRLDFIVQQDSSVDFILRKNDGGNTGRTFVVSGTVSFLENEDADPTVGTGVTVSIWQEDSPPRISTVGQDGTYRFGGLREGTWQMGAAMEGYTTVTTEPFELSANKTQNFTLEKDPDYQWGPGQADGELGCQCSSSDKPGPLVLMPILLGMLWRRRH